MEYVKLLTTFYGIYNVEDFYLSYFQFLDLPSAIHFTAVSNRLILVASVLASVIQRIYSFLLLGLNASNVACAFLFFLRAAARSCGTSSSVFIACFCFGGNFISSSFKRAASFI